MSPFFRRDFARIIIVAALVAATGTYAVDPVYAWSHLAGTLGGPGAVDGTVANARFNQPGGAAVDSAGNVYVADAENSTVRKISSLGVVTTLAGEPRVSGSTDGMGRAARFNQPSAVAVDGTGNIYVSDTGSSIIRKVTPAGAVTTLAGSAWQTGGSDGTGAAARFNRPNGVAVDVDGNVYVADTGNYAIRKITPAGVVTTLAGMLGSGGSANGTGTAARFNAPQGVAVDGGGNVFVADTANQLIRRITPAGVVTTLAGTAGAAGGADGTGATARFVNPRGIVFHPDGNLYVADTGYNTIRKVTAAGVVTTLAGTASSIGGHADGMGPAARFSSPAGLAVNAFGQLLVAEIENHTIRLVTTAGAVSTYAGAAPDSGWIDATGAAARFNAPFGACVDGDGNVYVADQSNSVIRKITPGGVVTTLAGAGGQVGSADGTGTSARFRFPLGVAVDGGRNIYVADTGNHTIRKITEAGMVTTLAGTAGQIGWTDATGAAARFTSPRGLAVDIAGNVFVADSLNHTIRVITPAGAVTTLAGTAGQLGTANGVGSLARFNNPYSVAVDTAGNVYVADSANYAIRKITPARSVTTLAGLAGMQGYSNGTGAEARFMYPSGLVADGAGSIYVADSLARAIRKVTAAGVVTTLAGRLGVEGTDDGPADIVGFFTPCGIAIDTGGNFYVSDPLSHAIRKGTATIAPVITTPPMNQSVVMGGTAVFAVTATGPDLHYQWTHDGVDLPGETGSTLTLTNVPFTAFGAYVVRVYNGGASAMSPPALLTVAAAGGVAYRLIDYTAPPATGNSAIFLGPTWTGVSHTRAVVSDAAKTITCYTGQGTPVPFQRSVVETANAYGVYAAGVFTVDEAWTDYVLTSAGRVGWAGFDESPSAHIRLDQGLLWPESLVIGESATESSDAYFNGAYAGVLTAALRLIAIETVVVPAGTFVGCLHVEQRTPDGGQFNVEDQWWAPGVGTVKVHRVKANGDTEDRVLMEYSLASGMLPTITTQPADQAVRIGTAATFTVAASGSGLTYKWWRLLPGGTVWAELAASSVYSGVATVTLTVTGATLPMSGEQYRCVVTNGVGPRQSNNATLIVHEETYTSFAAWATGTGAAGGPTADPDGVGVANLLRYAFDLPPPGLPITTPVTPVNLTVDAGSTYLAVTIHRKSYAPDIRYVVESSADLINWTMISTLSAGFPRDVVVRDTVPTTAAARRFLRVRVEVVP